MSQQPLIRPAQLDQLPFLDAQQKQNYKNGLANLWSQYESHPEGSQAWLEAKQKLQTASQKIMQHITSRTRPAAANGQAARPPQNGGQQPPPGQATAVSQQAGTAAQQQPQQNAQQNAQASGDPDAAIKARITQEINSKQLYPPENVTSQAQFDQHKTAFKTQLGSMMFKLEKAKEGQQQLTQHIAQLKATNQQPSAEVKSRWIHLKGVMEQMNAQIQELNAQNEKNRQTLEEKRQQRAAGNNGAAQANRVNGADASGTPRPPTQQGLPQNVTQDAQQLNTSSPAPSQPNSAQRPPQPTPLPQQQPQQRQMPQQGVAQQPQRPPINPQAAQQYGSQYPQSAVPGSAVQQQPHALSQQGAIARAQQNNQQANMPQQPPAYPNQQQIPNGVNFNAQPPQQQQGTPTSATPSHHQTQAPLNSKFPIPKTLNLGPQTQAPVGGPPPRPTMMQHTGMMSMPGIQKPPPFNLEGDSDHVLSKRKLDELVRQVTGTTNPADGLSPEVEEAVLSMTDDFVDNVITKACQLAKLRQGQTLELRDLQYVLEKNYGLRIPGYALDEVRAVRKYQPSAGWIQKHQAISNSKIMKGSKDAA